MGKASMAAHGRAAAGVSGEEGPALLARERARATFDVGMLSAYLQGGRALGCTCTSRLTCPCANHELGT